MEEQEKPTTYYEYMQGITNSLPSYDKELLEKAKTQVANYIMQDTNPLATHYMLLNQKSPIYITIFEKSKSYTSARDFAETIINLIAQDLGEIKTIEKDKGGGLAFWVRPFNKDTTTCYLLFDYSQGVVMV